MRANNLYESAATELKDKLPSLKKTDYDTIDNLMKRISKRFNISGKKLHDLFVSKYGHTPDTWIKKYKEKHGGDDSLTEFLEPNRDEGEEDFEEILRRLAAKWWLGTEQDMIRVERTLQGMGWEIGEDEGYDDGGVFVVRAGDINGKSYISWPHEDLIDMPLNEAFNNPYPIQWDDEETDDDSYPRYDAYAKLSDGTPLEINFNVDDNDEWQVEFWRNRNIETTGEGDQQRVFATVLEAIKQFIKMEHPQVINFSAAKDDTPGSKVYKRANLYNTLVQRYADSVGYTAQSNDTGDTVVFSLRSKKSLEENLHQWFKEKWVRFGPDGKIRGSCARGDSSEGKPKCLPQAKAHALGKKGRKYAANKKRREDPNPERSGKAINVATKKKKANEGQVLPFKRSNPLTPNVITQLKALSQTALELFWEGSYMPTAAQGQMAQLGKKEEKRLFDETNKRLKALGYEYSINEEDSDKLYLHSIAREAWYDAEKPPQQFNGMPDLLYDAQTNKLSYYDLIGDDGYEYNDTTQFDESIVENTASGINKLFNNLGDPVFSNLQRVALLAMQGRQQEASGRLQSVIKDASPDVQKKIIDAVNNIKPVTINGKIADSSALDKSKPHQDWILNNFIPWVQSLLKQGVTEGEVLPFKRPQSVSLTWQQIPKDVLILANDWFWADMEDTGSAAVLDPKGYGSGTKNNLQFITAQLQQRGWKIDYDDDMNVVLTNKKGQSVVLPRDDAYDFEGWAADTDSDIKEGEVIPFPKVKKKDGEVIQFPNTQVKKSSLSPLQKKRALTNKDATPINKPTNPDIVKEYIDFINEAGSMAQQAAIAINMKKRHKKPKHVSEDVTDNDDMKILNHFIKWSIKKLHVKKPPEFHFSKDTEKAKEGHHTGVHTNNKIWVYIGNRNLIDICRTIFHELVHQRQDELNMIKHGDSYPGSPIEAMADMMAGKYIKIYGKEHPEIFQ